MTQIDLLPVANVDFEIATNEDWRSTFVFANPDNSAISLAGIAFDMMVRPFVGSPTIVLSASSSPTINGFVPSGTLTPGGTSGNELAITIPLAAMQRVPALSAACVYDVVARGDGVQKRIMFGQVVFDQGVTE